MTFSTRVGRRLKSYAALAGSLPANIIRLNELAGQAAAAQKTVTAIILTGRLGDLVAAQSILPLLAAPGKILIWLVKPHYADILAHNPSLAAIIPVTSTTEALLLRRLVPAITWRNLHIDKTFCQDFGFPIRNPNPHSIDFDNFYNTRPLADIYGLLAADRILGAPPIIHLAPGADPAALQTRFFAAPKNPLLVFHPVSEEPDRAWPRPHAETLADWLLQNTDFNIFEPGLTPCLRPAARLAAPGPALALRDQIALASAANLFIGVDSAFAHLANAFEIASILLLGPYRHFRAHLPWRLSPRDTLLRTPSNLDAIQPWDVIAALQNTVGRKTQALSTTCSEPAPA